MNPTLWNIKEGQAFTKGDWERVRKYQSNQHIPSKNTSKPRSSKQNMCWGAGCSWQSSVHLLLCPGTYCNTWIMSLVNKSYIATVTTSNNQLSLRFVKIMMPPNTYDALTKCHTSALQPLLRWVVSSGFIEEHTEAQQDWGTHPGLRLRKDTARSQSLYSYPRWRSIWGLIWSPQSTFVVGGVDVPSPVCMWGALKLRDARQLSQVDN